jgi:hypothetical protein
MQTSVSRGVVFALAACLACDRVIDDAPLEVDDAEGLDPSAYAAELPTGTSHPAHVCKDDVDPPDATAVVPGECPPEMCGLNGAWLGEGVPFRQLGCDTYTRNDQGIRLRAFVDRFGRSMTLGVEGDELVGRLPGGARVRGTSLTGAQILLRRLDPDGSPPFEQSYRLRIVSVTFLNFDARCIPGAPCVDRQVPIYEIEGSRGDGCVFALCKPGLDPGDELPDIRGKTVIFVGDSYDERTLAVTIDPPPYGSSAPSCAPARFFNIACIDTAIAKLHLLRHTSASQTPGAGGRAPTARQRQTMLRLLTGDYCGNGMHFTTDGVPLTIDFASALYRTGGGPFGTEDAVNADACWDGVAAHATCLGRPRWFLAGSSGRDEPTLISEIQESCRSVGSAVFDLPRCDPALSPSSVASCPSGYAISGNR